MSEVKCPQCSNIDKDKMSKQKEVDEIEIYLCEVCKFRWGIRK